MINSHTDYTPDCPFCIRYRTDECLESDCNYYKTYLAESQSVINTDDRPELIGQIIDIFEDFLEEKGIDIENPEKEDDPDSAAIIYGSDYGTLQSQLEEAFINWGILRKEV